MKFEKIIILAVLLLANPTEEAENLSSTIVLDIKFESMSLTFTISIDNLRKIYNISSYELEIYTLKEYYNSLVLVYIIETATECVIINAYNGQNNR